MHSLVQQLCFKHINVTEIKKNNVQIFSHIQ